MTEPEPFRDDPSISDEEGLYRCIHPLHYDEAEDRPSSATFKSKTDPHPSVDRESLSTPEESLARKPNHMGVARLITGTVRELTVGVASDPLEDNPAHAMIIRDLTMSDHHWNKVARKLAKACTWALRARGK
jgi:hypothetical protein